MIDQLSPNPRERNAIDGVEDERAELASLTTACNANDEIVIVRQLEPRASMEGGNKVNNRRVGASSEQQPTSFVDPHREFQGVSARDTERLQVTALGLQRLIAHPWHPAHHDLPDRVIKGFAQVDE
jgi:hypothetical protein